MRARTTRVRAGRRHDVLRALRAATGPMTIVELADEVGVHPNTIRFHLDRLVGGGQVESVHPLRSGPGRPPALFQPVRAMDPGGPRRFRMLAEILTQSLASGPSPRRRAIAAGRAWGRRLPAPEPPETPTQHLLAMLDDLGFAPDRPIAEGDRRKIRLRHCPFLELAESSASIVCPIHLGLMQGVMETAGGPETVESLDPFVEPDLCVAHLAHVEAAS